MELDKKVPSEDTELIRLNSETFFSLIPHLACIASTDGCIKKLNSAWEEALGYSLEEMLGASFFDFLHPDDVEPAREEIQKLRKNVSTLNFVNRYRCKNGSYRWLEWKAVLAAGTSFIFAVARDVTKGKQAEEAQRLMEFMVDKIPDAIYWIKADGDIWRVNEAACSVLGYPREELLSLSVLDINPAATKESYSLTWSEIKEKGRKQYQSLHRTKEGRVFPVEITANYFRYGDLESNCAIVRDISQQMQIENELRESQQSFRRQLQELSQIYDLSPIGLFAVDRELRFLRINQRLADMNGRPISEHLGRTVDEVLPAHVVDTIKKICGPVLEQGETVLNVEFQGKVWRSPNLLRHWLGSYTPIFSDSGEVCGITGTVMEVTDRKLVEQERDITIKFLSLVNASKGSRDLIGTAVSFFQEQSGCQAVGIRLRQGDDFPYLETWGNPPQLVLQQGRLCPGCTLNDTDPGDGGDSATECVCGRILRGDYDTSAPHFTTCGTFWTNSTTDILPSTASDGACLCMRIGIDGEPYQSVALIPLRSDKERLGLLQLNDPMQDRFSEELISLWERLVGHLSIALANFSAKEELHKSRELLQKVIDESSDSIFVKDTKGRYVLFNHESARFTGNQVQDVLGKDDASLFPPDVVQSLMEHDREVISSGNTATFKELVPDTTGKVRTFLTTKGPLSDEQGNLTGIFGISRDITDEIQAEETLLTNQEQLRSLAIELSLVEERERRQIATELHDEIGQNLALIKIKTDEISRAKLSATCTKTIREIRELIEITIQEVRSLTFQISPPLLYEVGFEAAVEWLAEQFEDKHHLRITIKNDDSPTDSPKPLNDELGSTLYHVVRELLVNVVKHARARKVSISLGHENDRMKVVVADSGRGFAISGPGKEREKLSGFGLFNIRQRIQHLGGEIEIDSQVGAGTKVTIKVPYQQTRGGAEMRHS